MIRRRTYNAIADINVTNLVDVVLVLLIVFMISAPLLQSGFEVDLPTTETAALSSDTDGIVITITRKGAILIDDEYTDPAEFEDNLNSALNRIGRKTVFIKADSAASYGTVVKVMGKMKKMGIDDLGLLTMREESKDKK